MHTSSLSLRLLPLAALLSLSACVGGETPPVDDGPDSCVPGAAALCACAGGVPGVQVCTDDGTFDECVCDAPAEPETSEPESSEPETSEPETGEPEATDGGTAEPETSEPETSEPETSEPDVAPGACDDDEYLAGGTCHALTTCTEKEFEYRSPTATSDRDCRPEFCVMGRDPTTPCMQATAVTVSGNLSECAADEAGRVHCWAGGRFEYVPDNLGVVVDLFGSDDHVCALNTDNQLSCWERISGDLVPLPFGLDDIIEVSTSEDTVCAMQSNLLTCVRLDAGTANDFNPNAGSFQRHGQTYSTGSRCWLDDDGWASGSYDYAGLPTSNIIGVRCNGTEVCALSADGDRVCQLRDNPPETTAGVASFIAGSSAAVTTNGAVRSLFVDDVRRWPMNRTPWTFAAGGNRFDGVLIGLNAEGFIGFIHDYDDVPPFPPSRCDHDEYDDGTGCQRLTQCTAYDYQSTPPSMTHDRVCTTLTVCGDGETETTPPTEDSDRVCN